MAPSGSMAGFAVNEWLIQEGLLVLNEQPTQITPFAKLKVNWAKTKVWSEGGYYAAYFSTSKIASRAGLFR
jgi:predicted AlkP superfamily phosphohydrolase/phosphomutase